jgi:hypothetical protein
MLLAAVQEGSRGRRRIASGDLRMVNIVFLGSLILISELVIPAVIPYSAARLILKLLWSFVPEVELFIFGYKQGR